MPAGSSEGLLSFFWLELIMFSSVSWESELFICRMALL